MTRIASGAGSGLRQCGFRISFLQDKEKLIIKFFLFNFFSISLAAHAQIVDVCTRSPSVQYSLTYKSGKPCDQITANDLMMVRNVTIKGNAPLKSYDLANLSNLDTIHFQDGNIEKLPEGFFSGLSNLGEISFSEFNIKVIPSGSFRDLSYLDSFSATASDIPLYDDMFMGAANIRSVAFTFSSAIPISSIPPKLLYGLPELRQFYFRNTGIQNLPISLFYGNRLLREVEITDNPLLKTLPLGLFFGLEKMTDIRMGHNAIEKIPPGSFVDLKNLEKLWLGSNQLTDIPPGLFSGLPKLRDLDLAKNKIPSLRAGTFVDLPMLWNLYLRWNQISILEDHVFRDLPNLSLLNLSLNEIKDVSPNVFSLGSFAPKAWLNIEENPLTPEARQLLINTLGNRVVF